MKQSMKTLLIGYIFAIGIAIAGGVLYPEPSLKQVIFAAVSGAMIGFTSCLAVVENRNENQ